MLLLDQLGDKMLVFSSKTKTTDAKMTQSTEEKVEKLILETVDKIAAGDLRKLFNKDLTLEVIFSK